MPPRLRLRGENESQEQRDIKQTTLIENRVSLRFFRRRRIDTSVIASEIERSCLIF